MAAHPLSITFGLRVLELRKAAGFSQEGLALHTGIARSYMSRIERGKAEPKFEVLEKLSTGLGVPVSALFEPPATLPNSPKQAKPPKVVLEVPFAKDGTCFNPTLRRPRAGTFTVGPKNAEKRFVNFDEALEFLRANRPACWLRPNSSGDWGVVTEVRWDPLPEEFR